MLIHFTGDSEKCHSCVLSPARICLHLGEYRIYLCLNCLKIAKASMAELDRQMVCETVAEATHAITGGKGDMLESHSFTFFPAKQAIAVALKAKAIKQAQNGYTLTERARKRREQKSK